MKRSLILAAVVLTGSLSKAQPVSFTTGQHLHEACKDANKDLDDSEKAPLRLLNARYCDAYIMASLETLSYEYDLSIHSVTAAQLAAIVNQYWDQHPEMWGMPASALVRNAFLKAFPGKRVVTER